MKFADNKNLYIRRALFALMLCITAVFQHTDGAVPSIGSAKAFVLIPLMDLNTNLVIKNKTTDVYLNSLSSEERGQVKEYIGDER